MRPFVTAMQCVSPVPQRYDAGECAGIAAADAGMSDAGESAAIAPASSLGRPRHDRRAQGMCPPPPLSLSLCHKADSGSDLATHTQTHLISLK
jgi:hypothetical protein